MSPSQAPFAAVYDAGQVRLEELVELLLAQEADYLPTEAAELALLDLAIGLEASVGLPVPQQGARILGYLMETYGLLAVGTDPFLRPSLPPIPVQGATVRRLVLGLGGGRVLGLGGGKVLGIGATLAAATSAVAFSDDLLPGQTVGAVTYNGMAGSVFSFNMPLPDSVDGPQVMFLFVAGVQVSRVDFPLTAVGAPFRLTMNGTDYIGAFQANPSRLDLTA